MKFHYHWAVTALFVVALGAGISPLAFAAGSFTPLGVLPGGSYESRAWGVSADGSVVVGDSLDANGYQAFRWTQGGGMAGLGYLPGGSETYSNARGVSGDGSVVVGTSTSTDGDQAFRWTQGGGMVGLGDLPGGIFDSKAYGVNADGSVVVGSGRSASGIEAFRWTQGGGMQSVADWLAAAGVSLPAGWLLTEALDVSADGSVIVGIGVLGGGLEAWRAEVSAVPIPAAVWLFGSGLLGLIGFARRKKRAV